MKSVFLCIILAALPTASLAAPFGIGAGTPIKSLDVQARYGQKSFVVRPPKLDSNFSEYIAIATPPHGVCAVIGRTGSFINFSEARAKQSMLTKLLSKYGKSKQIRPGKRAPLIHMTSSDFPRQWKGRLPYNLDSIIVETVEENERFVVELSYFYQNMAKCDNWVPNGDREGL